jgi:transcriptional regulator with XRE-family HTH domain
MNPTTMSPETSGSHEHGRHARHEPRSPVPARDPVDVHIGARLRLRRRALGQSQSELARQLSVTYQQVCKYEAGENRISAAKLFLASDVLSCPISFFFEGLSRNGYSPSPSEREAGERTLSHVLSRPYALRLAGDFSKIRNRRLRRHLLRLVACLAEEETEADGV